MMEQHILPIKPIALYKKYNRIRHPRAFHDFYPVHPLKAKVFWLPTDLLTTLNGVC